MIIFICYFFVLEIENDAQGYHITDEKEHEAGYDAYITGLCFLAMWKYLGMLLDNKAFEYLWFCSG